jgi:hypothetical protein
MVLRCLYFTQQQLVKNDGASDKATAQNDAINKIGIESHLAHVVPNTEVGWKLFIDDKVVANVKKYKLLYNQIVEYIEHHRIQLIYIRYSVNSSFHYITFLKKVAKLGVKIYLEIPTYPYDGELKCSSIKPFIKKYLERLYRNMWKGCVYRIVTSSTAAVIYGIPTITISNAPAHDLPVKKSLPIEGRINMIAVANLAFWHGYDRIIRGLAQYYKSNPELNVYLTIAGVGNVTVYNDLKTLTEELQLNNFVRFVGSKSNEELDSYFDNAHLAIGCLGCHRKNIIEVKSLKNVEYAMRGIPMVYSENNTDFDGKVYVLKVPADDSNIDIKFLCDFVVGLNMTPLDIHNSVENFTWDVQMRKVFAEWL